MFDYKLGKYRLRLLDKNNLDELKTIQRLRYNDLLKEFNDELDDNGLDDDHYDMYSDSLVVIDEENNVLVGTYRLASYETGLNKLLLEDEFDISELKKQKDKILELGRAVVKKEYRSGAVINILWFGLFQYSKMFNYRYLIGTCSLYGTDPSQYINTLSYLNKYSLSEFDIRSIKNSYEYYNEDIDKIDAEKQMPSLLKAYLRLGAKVSRNGYIDYDFNSCDVLIIVDTKNANQRYIDFYSRILKQK